MNLSQSTLAVSRMNLVLKTCCETSPTSLLRCICDNVLDSLFPESQILPQVCWLLGGRGSQDLYSLYPGMTNNTYFS